jgi:GntR family transcriptional regulator
MDAQAIAEITGHIFRSRGQRTDLAGAVAYAIREQIVSGSLAGGERLDNEIELAQALEISRPTLREATRMLIHNGLLVSRRGVGTFVTKRAPRLVHGQLDMGLSMTDLIRRVGGEPGSMDCIISKVKASGAVAEALDIVGGTHVALIERTRLIDSEPLAWANEYVTFANEAEFASIQRFDGGSLFHFLTKTLRRKIAYNKLVLTAVSASTKIAGSLHLRRGHPLLLIHETHYDADGLPILYFINHYNTELVDFAVVRPGPKS